MNYLFLSLVSTCIGGVPTDFQLFELQNPVFEQTLPRNPKLNESRAASWKGGLGYPEVTCLPPFLPLQGPLGLRGAEFANNWYSPTTPATNGETDPKPPRKVTAESGLQHRSPDSVSVHSRTISR